MATSIGTGPSQQPGQPAAEGGGSRGIEVIMASILWVLVTIALAYGVFQTATRAARLFTG